MRGRGALGKHGEDDVCQFLIERGHTILDRNWRSGHLEIDIVTLAPDGIHFVEVKSRVAPVQGEPQDAVTAAYRFSGTQISVEEVAGIGQ